MAVRWIALVVSALLANGVGDAAAGSATRAQMLAAAKTVQAASAVLIAKKRELGIWPGPDIDPNETGMVGQEYTPMTTTAATLADKRTATNFDFAAALVRYMAGVGVGSGSKVLLIELGSFLGADLAVLAALQALDADVTYIPSLGSSQWGANDLELNLAEILALLSERGILTIEPLAVVLGGRSATGGNMEPGAPDVLRASIARHDFPFVGDRPLVEIVDELAARVRGATGGGKSFALMVKVGGSVISLGTCPENRKYASDGGLRPRLETCSGSTPGLLYMLGRDDTPVLQILNMRAISEEMGLPYDPVPMPVPGENARVYGVP